jgi:hypothetical protein
VVIKRRYRCTSTVHQSHLWSRRCLATRRIRKRFAVPSLFATHPILLRPHIARLLRLDFLRTV